MKKGGKVQGARRFYVQGEKPQARNSRGFGEQMENDCGKAGNKGKDLLFRSRIKGLAR